jgi:hypothetical protein
MARRGRGAGSARRCGRRWLVPLSKEAAARSGERKRGRRIVSEMGRGGGSGRKGTHVSRVGGTPRVRAGVVGDKSFGWVCVSNALVGLDPQDMR